MLGFVAKVHIHLLKHLIFSFKARRGLQRKNRSRQNSAQANTARSWLHAVLANFGFSQIFEIVWNITIWILNSLEIEIFEIQQISLTPRSVSLRSVRLRAVLWILEN